MYVYIDISNLYYALPLPPPKKTHTNKTKRIYRNVLFCLPLNILFSFLAFYYFCKLTVFIIIFSMQSWFLYGLLVKHVLRFDISICLTRNKALTA